MRIHFYHGHIPVNKTRKMSKVVKQSRKSSKPVVFSKLDIFKLNRKGETQNG